jgi:3-hydroxyisobutyrate dehydrogenase-like beta-hydroxyacid dehydrogenase
MGTPIIGHLVRSGQTTYVFDPDPARASEIDARGGIAVDRPAQLAAHCWCVLVCVGYEHELVAALSGSQGLLAQLAPDSVVAVVSTVSPERVVALAEEGARTGVHVIDAPVCRGGWSADNAELLCFVGGSEQVTERVRPVISAYASDIVRVGHTGCGQVAKAVNNLILWACLVADHEGLALAAHYELDLDALRAALMTSSAENHALENWGHQTMAWAEDDLRIVQEMAVDAHLALPQAGLDRELCRALRPRRYDVARYGR